MKDASRVVNPGPAMPNKTQFPQRPTVADVAAEAGVAAITVSRVIEGSDKVAAKTRAKVVTTMEALGYFGNAAATQLVSGRTQTIGIVTSNIIDFGYASTILGIERRARERGWSVLIAAIEDSSPESIRQTVGTVASRALAGVVVIDYDDVAHAVVPAIPSYLPVVTTSGPSISRDAVRPHVSIDDYLGAVAAAEHLIGLGHRSIFVVAPPNYELTESRSIGTLDALNRARLPHYPVARCDSWRPGSGYAAAVELLDAYGDDITAMACGNDELALGAIRAVVNRGLRVPEDVSVVGFDDNPLAAFASPPLTTVAQDFNALGYAAFDLLVGLIEGLEPEESTKPAATLVVRESTAAPNPQRGWGRASA